MATPILALTGASNPTIQSLLLTSARRWNHAGRRIVGVVEVPSSDGIGHRLKDLATGAQYAIYQELGSGSEACRLCGSGIIEACESLCRQIAAGCDLVVISKFGKLEAARSGLIAAFSAAIVAEKPIVTAVAPSFVEAWQCFAGPLSSFSAPEEAAIEAWRSMREAKDYKI
ncbi:DUF2478 domain-containing protein [Methylorubrum extorquens]|uniref:DUF2478 domain-containing protein n=1 Tax=Methylorubrum extorquens (strain CM4 / NCIMB 13688) TaxID=440085 RepID=B7L340_METC4|nr:DUF2478 domain-containing protein [Methylorubrum extorquens]ACK86248.1 conserved hypothetical protein [Methylorubrum extorquens CM4]